MPDEWRECAEVGQFVFVISKEAEKQVISIRKITEIGNVTSFGQPINLETLSENEKIHLVSNEFFMSPMIDVLEAHNNDSWC